MKVIARYTKDDRPDIVKKTYKFFNTNVRFDESLRPNPDSLQNMIGFLGETNPAAKTAKADQFIDTRFVDKLPK